MWNQADGVARRKKATKLRRISYLAAAGRIHEHRQHAVEIARRQSRIERAKRIVLYPECLRSVKSGRLKALYRCVVSATLAAMSADEKPKSALELAMERLRKQDADSGAVERAVTDAQRAAIAEARSLHASKVAELEILHRANMARVFDPAERTQAADDYRRDLQRLNDDLERKVGKIRGEKD
jgi:hypothetical protein